MEVDSSASASSAGATLLDLVDLLGLVDLAVEFDSDLELDTGALQVRDFIQAGGPRFMDGGVGHSFGAARFREDLRGEGVSVMSVIDVAIMERYGKSNDGSVLLVFTRRT
jgi:hypothetical protein